MPRGVLGACIVLASSIAIALSAAGVSRSRESRGQKPTRTIPFHTEGGPGTPSTLEGIWQQSDVVALVEVVQGRPDDHTFTTQQSDERHTVVRTVYSSSIIELFKANEPPSTLDIEVMGGKRDRGDHFEELVDDRMPPLKIGGRYIVFLRVATGRGTYLPATADASSVYRVEGSGIISQGKSQLARTLERDSLDELVVALRSLKGGR